MRGTLKKVPNVKHSNFNYLMLAAAPLLIMVVYYLAVFFGKKTNPTTSGELPTGCPNFVPTVGHWQNSSVILVAEHHDQSIESLQCILSMMTTMATAQFAVFFEGFDIESKKAILDKLSRLDYLTETGVLSKEICTKAKTCGSWDHRIEFKNAGTSLDVSFQAMTLVEVSSQIRKKPISTNDEALRILKSMLDNGLRINSYLNEHASKIRSETIQKIINKYSQEESKRKKAAIKSIPEIILEEFQSIQRAVSPHCDAAPLEKLPDCIQKSLVINETPANARNSRFFEHVNSARKNRKKSGNLVSIFKAGDSHVRAVEKMLGDKTDVAIVRHRRVI